MFVGCYERRHMGGKAMTLREAAARYGIPYSTLTTAIYEGRLDARKSAGTWLTTEAAIDQAIKEGKLRPRKRDD
jgi:hypothetical protein